MDVAKHTMLWDRVLNKNACPWNRHIRYIAGPRISGIKHILDILIISVTRWRSNYPAIVFHQTFHFLVRNGRTKKLASFYASTVRRKRLWEIKKSYICRTWQFLFFSAERWMQLIRLFFFCIELHQAVLGMRMIVAKVVEERKYKRKSFYT